MAAKKILVIRLSSAGDIILTSPLLKILKEREPLSEIHFVVKARYADLIFHNPNVNEVHLVQNDSGIHALEDIRRLFVREKFDLTLDLQNNFRSIYLRRGTSSDIRVIRKEVVKRAVLVRTKLNLFSHVRSVALKYAQTFDGSISSVGCPELFLPPDVIKQTDSIWNKEGDKSRPVIILCPGARHYTKRWPVEYWCQLAGTLMSKYQLVLLGGDEDVSTCRQIREASGALDFSGKLSLVESAAMLRHAFVVVTNDSFLMHAADALRKNLIALFGSSVHEFGFYPCGSNAKVLEMSDLECRPCSHVGRESCPKGHFNCMRGLTPEIVSQAISDFERR